MTRWSAWELAEAFHLAYAADYVVSTGLVDDDERSAEQLATTRGLNPTFVARMLELLAWRTDLVVRGDTGFRRGPGLGPSQRAVFDQYVGAYGPSAAALADVLAVVGVERPPVNRERHAQAFADARGAGAALLPGLLRQLQLNHVLDLGCGTGQMLVEMARDPEFRGHGVDGNPAMIDAARTRADDVAGQIRFTVADVSEPGVLSDDDVQVITAASLVNEFFHAPGQAATWLRSLRETFPGRLLVVADYYGALGHSPEPPPTRALHDWIQLISFQGIPPPDLDGWESVYKEAGCELAHSVEDARAGAFVHFVRLSR